MKVNIGPYPNRWRSNIHEHWLVWHHKVDYGWRVKEEEYDRLDKAVEWLEDKLQDLYNLTVNKYLDKKQRKIKVHVDGYDIWSADHTMALIIHPILLKLKECKHGSGHVDDEDVPEELRSTNGTKENEWETDSLFHNRYEWMLDVVIWTFEQLSNEDGGDNFTKFENDPNERFGLRITDTGEELRKVHNARINNGLRLFGKYYRSFWD